MLHLHKMILKIDEGFRTINRKLIERDKYFSETQVSNNCLNIQNFVSQMSVSKRNLVKQNKGVSFTCFFLEKCLDSDDLKLKNRRKNLIREPNIMCRFFWYTMIISNIFLAFMMILQKLNPFLPNFCFTFFENFGVFLAKKWQIFGQSHTQVFGLKKRMLFVQETMASTDFSGLFSVLS